MDLPNHFSQDWIETEDLTYSHPNGKYTFQFKYLGEGYFFLKSNGHLDEKSFKIQFSTGDIARRRLKEKYPEKIYHLIWDSTEITGVSFFARRSILLKLKGNENFGSISVVGAHVFAQSFIKLLLNTLPNIQFHFYNNLEEAINGLSKLKINLNTSLLPDIKYVQCNNKVYSHFINKWEENRKFLQVGNLSFKYIIKSDWIFQSPDKSFFCEISLIEGNIIFYKCEGYAKLPDIDHIYSILKNIIEEFGFNITDNKFYSIIDFKKVKGVSLSGRKRASLLEGIYCKFAHFVIFMPSNLLLLMYKVVKKISNANFTHWEIANTLDDAFVKIQQHQLGDYKKLMNPDNGIQLEPLHIPKDKQELIDLIYKQHNEIYELRKTQQEQILKILTFTGNMTWDESFIPPVVASDKKSPFDSVFESLIILYNDFKEIIEDTTLKALQLQESEDKYRNLINLANDVIAVYQDDKLRFVNSRVTSSLGYTPEEVIDKSMHSYVVPEEIIKLEEYYKKRMLNEDVPWVYETVFIHKDGYHVPVSMSVGRILYEGRPASMLIARDITQKKKTEEELERYRNHLEDIVRKRTEQLQKEVTDRRIAEESDRLKTAFLSNMSHEIRTPMNAIIGFSNFLKEPGLTQEQRTEYLNYIESSGQSLLNLINDIIDFSKIEAKQLNIQISKCKIDVLLDELYQLFEQNRKNNKKESIELKLLRPENRGVVLMTDPYRLKQILSNLLDNSLKFTDNGFIEFGYFYEKSDIVFYVKDTGIGIPPDKKELIFKRFGRLHSNNRNIGGTGLGLAISKNLASLLKGKLWVESIVMQGTTFYLKLPKETLVKDEEEIITSVKDIKSEYNWSGKKVLIVEDEDLNYKVLQIALARTGIEIKRSANGKEAVEFVDKSSDLDIILMDIQMPEMDGYEAMSRIKNKFPDLPIIAQTAFALLEERKKCLELGFDDYIPKPIHFTELYSKMDAFLKE